jgi:hypothetical protein
MIEDKSEDSAPNIKRFFSGKRFPFATLSSMDDQMFFLGPSLLDGRLLFPDIMSKIDPAQPVLTIPTSRGFYQSSDLLNASILKSCAQGRERGEQCQGTFKIDAVAGISARKSTGESSLRVSDIVNRLSPKMTCSNSK